MRYAVPMWHLGRQLQFQKKFEKFKMLHWLNVILLHFLCTKGSSLVKRPTHLKLPKSFQRLIFLSQPFIFLQRTVLAFLLFMQIQIAQSRKTSLIFRWRWILWTDSLDALSAEWDPTERRQFPQPLFDHLSNRHRADATGMKVRPEEALPHSFYLMASLNVSILDSTQNHNGLLWTNLQICHLRTTFGKIPE